MSENLSQISQNIVNNLINCLLIRNKSFTGNERTNPWFCPHIFVETIQKQFSFNYSGIVLYDKSDKRFSSVISSDSEITTFEMFNGVYDILEVGRFEIDKKLNNENNSKAYFHYDYWYRKEFSNVVNEKKLDPDYNLFQIEIRLPFFNNSELEYYFVAISINDSIEADSPASINENEFPLVVLIESWQHQLYFLWSSITEKNLSNFKIRNTLSDCNRLINQSEWLIAVKNIVATLPKDSSRDFIIETCTKTKNGCIDCSLANKNINNNSTFVSEKDFIQILLKWIWLSNIGPYDIGPVRRSSSHSEETSFSKDKQNILFSKSILDKFSHDIKIVTNRIFNSNSTNITAQQHFLNKFFFFCLYKSGEFGNDLISNFTNDFALSDHEFETRLKCTVDFTYYLYANYPITDNTIQSIIWFIDRYAHSVLKLHGRIDIKLHLLKAARAEPSLHTLKKFYRDHFFHAIEVCFLGHFLLELEINTENKKYLWQYVADCLIENNFPPLLKISPIEQKRLILKLWYLTALLHDIGYYIDIQKSIIDSLDFFSKSEYLKDFQKNLKSVISTLSEKISNDNFVNYCKADNPAEDHGIIGALHLFDLLRSINKDDSNINPNEYAPAIRAIALHNSRKQNVSFKNDPLAFLLILCDTVQEWNRPKFNYSTAPAEILSKFRSPTFDFSKGKNIIDKFEINSIVNENINGFKLSKDNESLIKFTLSFDNSVHLNHNSFNLWIDSTCNLQRLSLNGLPNGINFFIEYITPFHKDHDGNFYLQLYRLRDVANETHMRFLDSWFPMQNIDGLNTNTFSNGAISYSYDMVDSKESVGINLRELCKRKIITCEIDEFRKRLSRWREYNDDLDFKGDYGAPNIP